MITLLYTIGAIIVLLLVTAFLMGTTMTIERSITIEKSAKQVFDYLRIQNNQDHFSVWNMADPSMKKEFQGTDGTVGYIYRWDSTNKNVGAGEQEIKKIVDGESIEYEIRFIRPMENVAISKFEVKAVSANQSVVMWGFYGPMKFPMNIMKPFFTNMLGKDLAKGLQNLKNILEKK